MSFFSTRGGACVTASQAVLWGLAQDGGLYAPAFFPQLTQERIAALCSMSYQERARNACIGTERADLVLAGCAILDAIRKAFPLPRLRVADRGLREGMLVEMMRADGAMLNC